jgi:HK97 family phage portal protein
MRLPFGYQVTVSKSIPPDTTAPFYHGNSHYGNWWNGGWIHEPFTGAWQRNAEIRLENVLSFSTVYACVTLIASDIGKLPLRYVEKDSEGIWEERENPAFSPVLRKPNRYQTKQKFIEQWMTSKLVHGNTYVLKERDQRGVVTDLYILDPCLTRPMVAADGSIWYTLATYNVTENSLVGLIEQYNSEGIQNGNVIVPASEIIHDINIALYHPLCGVSPISACGLAALNGIRIQQNSTRFFENASRPGGILAAPGPISKERAIQLKEYWEANFTGLNAGKTAVLGDGLKYEQMSVNPVDADLINQLKMSSEQVCSAFHVPGFMVGVGATPSYNNIEALYQMYYSQCLQTHLEGIEASLDDGLGLIGPNQSKGTEFDLDFLLRMDAATQMRTYGEGVARGILAPDEARYKLNYGKTPGGENPYLQQQNYSLEALSKRDSKDDPFAPNKPPPAPPAPKPVANAEAQRSLPPPPLDWSKKSVLKVLANATP